MKYALPLATGFLVFCLLQTAPAQTRTTASDSQPNRLFAHESIEKAWEAAVQSEKPLLVMFTSKRCAYCTKMLEQTYGDPAVLQLLSREVEAVVAKAEDYRPLIKKMRIRGYPSTLIISPEGDVLALMQGYVEAKKFAERVTPLIKPHLASAKASPHGRGTADR